MLETQENIKTSMKLAKKNQTRLQINHAIFKNF